MAARHEQIGFVDTSSSFLVGSCFCWVVIVFFLREGASLVVLASITFFEDGGEFQACGRDGTSGIGCAY